MKETSSNEMVTDRRRIIELMEQGALRCCEIAIRIQGSTQTFQSAMEIKAPADLSALRECKYLCITPLDPPIGNIKLRTAPQVLVQFTSGEQRVELVTRFHGLMPDKTIQLAFPGQLVLQEQLRSNSRVPVFEESSLDAMVTPPDSLGITCTIIDISRGGFAFRPANPDLPELVKGKVQVALFSELMPPLDLTAEILGKKVRDGHTGYRAAFNFKNIKERNAVEFLVANMEKKQKQRRQALFELSSPLPRSMEMSSRSGSSSMAML